MDEHVRLEGAHEDERRGAGIADAQNARRLRSLEVLRDDLQAAAGRRVGIARVERQNDRGLRAGKHVDGEVLRERALDEGHELLGDMTQHHARVGRGIDCGEVEDELRNLDAARLHGRGE